jgi:hypothetical protein
MSVINLNNDLRISDNLFKKNVNLMIVIKKWQQFISSLVSQIM